jgi:hypothetical protein
MKTSCESIMKKLMAVLAKVSTYYIIYYFLEHDVITGTF